MRKVEDQFVNIELNIETLDRYSHRTSIFKALHEANSLFSGNLLDVGCGQMPYKDYLISINPNIENYIGLDLEASSIHNTSRANLHWDGNVMPLGRNEIDSVIATEVLEHCPEPWAVLSEINRVLKPGGSFFFTVPFLWPFHEVPYDEFRYTPFALERLLKQAGFKEIQIKPLGGWNASLAQMLGLWLKRSPYPAVRKKYLVHLLLPVIKYLLKTDIKPVEYKESTMVTGLYGISTK